MPTVLGVFPSGYNIGPGLMSGPNGRYYSSVELSDDPTNFFSITPTPGSAHFCPAQAINPTFTQNLPGGGFLGLGA